jgi:uncharacterized protein (DUF1697 family)
MTVGIAFIRGINVGGKNPVPMATLRTVCEQAGLRGARTYIQSGNVAFRAPPRELTRAAAAIAKGIQARAGITPEVVVRSLDDLREIIAARPFDADPAKLIVMFLGGVPAASACRAVEDLKPDPERLALRGREIFIHFPSGMGTSKLSTARIEKLAGHPGTCRNWNTVLKMAELAAELE